MKMISILILNKLFILFYYIHILRDRYFSTREPTVASPRLVGTESTTIIRKWVFHRGLNLSTVRSTPVNAR